MRENSVVFPAPAQPHQCDSVAIVHLKGGVLEQRSAAERHFKISNNQHGKSNCCAQYGQQARQDILEWSAVNGGSWRGEDLFSAFMELAVDFTKSQLFMEIHIKTS